MPLELFKKYVVLLEEDWGGRMVYVVGIWDVVWERKERCVMCMRMERTTYDVHENGKNDVYRDRTYLDVDHTNK